MKWFFHYSPSVYGSAFGDGELFRVIHSNTTVDEITWGRGGTVEIVAIVGLCHQSMVSYSQKCSQYLIHE